MAKARRLVIVGAPGSGKTTLIRWLALTFAQNQQGNRDRLGSALRGPRLPVVIELRRLARWIEEPARWPGAEGLAPQLARFLAEDPRFHGDIMTTIQTAMERASCLLLFDGLDEVANPTLRRRIAEAIGAFARADQAGRNLFVVTSRPSGFRDVDLGPNFEVGEVEPFTSADMREFLGQWYATAYGEQFRPNAATLVRDIESKDRIAALATNPLLCTVIAIVYRKGGQLPNRRVELYEECCKVLLETWDKARGVERPIVLEGLDWSSRLSLLGELAFWMHEQGEEVVAGRNQVVEQIRAPLAKMRQVGEAEAGVEAENFVAAIEDQAGLIQGRGDGTLEFSHGTFQEYLAARHIAEQPGDGVLDLFMPHLNEAWWEEVHLLVLGRLGGSAKDAAQAACLIHALLNVYPKPRPWLHRTDWVGSMIRWDFPTWQHKRQISWLLGRELVLAVRGYADARPEARDPLLQAQLKREIANFLARVVRGQAAAEYLVTNRDPAVVELVSWPLVNALADPDWTVRYLAALALETAAATNAEARAALLRAFADPQTWVRGAAAAALGRAAATDPEARAALLKALQDADALVRRAAVQALGPAVADPEARAALFKALDDPEESVRSAAATALTPLAANPEARTALLKALGESQEWLVRSGAAIALGPAAADPDVRAALLKTLGDLSARATRAAAEALGRAAAADADVRVALLKAVQDPNIFLRRAAVLALGPAAAVDPEARAAVLNASGDPDVEVPCAAAEALAAAAVVDLEARTALLSMLAHPDVFVRAAAAKALGLAAPVDPGVRAPLFKALEDQEQLVRRSAAEAPGPAAVASPEARAALLKALEDQGPLVRRAAAQALGLAAAADPEARAALLTALEDSDIFVRRAAAEVLGQIAPKLEESDSSRILKALLRYLNWARAPWALSAISRAVEGRPLPGYRWVPLAERARRRLRRARIRVVVYVASFALLAAFGIAALAGQLPAHSIFMRTGGTVVILVPLIVALMQLYDRMKPRPV